MKKSIAWLTSCICLLISVCASAQKPKSARPGLSVQSPIIAATPQPANADVPPYRPASQPLYSTIVRLDSLYFDTYNHSKPALMDSLTADDIEFFHDRGGLLTSKTELLQSIRNNIFGKVTRVLTPGSIEVYAIPGYGAVEFGYHRFRNLIEHSESAPARFVIFWRLKNDKWQLAKVVSLH